MSKAVVNSAGSVVQTDLALPCERFVRYATMPALAIGCAILKTL
jgi:hypothetical protein